jgi:hypothetical protein
LKLNINDESCFEHSNLAFRASAALLLIRPQLKEESQLLELLQILEIRGQQTPRNEQIAARAPFGLRIEAETPPAAA